MAIYDTKNMKGFCFPATPFIDNLVQVHEKTHKENTRIY